MIFKINSVSCWRLSTNTSACKCNTSAIPTTRGNCCAISRRRRSFPTSGRSAPAMSDFRAIGRRCPSANSGANASSSTSLARWKTSRRHFSQTPRAAITTTRSWTNSKPSSNTSIGCCWKSLARVERASCRCPRPFRKTAGTAKGTARTTSASSSTAIITRSSLSGWKIARSGSLPIPSRHAVHTRIRLSHAKH